MKIKVDLDIAEKEKAQIAYEELQKALDEEGEPQCPVCQRRFKSVDIKHQEENENTLNNENMENSNQTGYGTTENYQLVSVQCKKCDNVFRNYHLLRIHMRKHTQKKQEVLKFIQPKMKTIT